MIIVCGEALIDLVPGDRSTYRPRPGGSPANVAVGLGRLELEVALLARIAEDGFGRVLRQHLAESNVDLSLAITSDEPTTLAVVTLDDDGKAEYAFYVDGSADGGWHQDELPAELPGSGALHVSGSLALGVDSMGDTLEQLLVRERPLRVLTFDPNLRPALAHNPTALRERLDHWITLVDVVKIGSDDLEWLAPGEPVDQIAETWLGRGPSLVVVTLGADGVYALGPDGPIELLGEVVKVADTVGAGDSFMGGFLAYLEEHGNLTKDGLKNISTPDLTDALKYAQHIAAITCSRLGADPPWKHELEAESAGLGEQPATESESAAPRQQTTTPSSRATESRAAALSEQAAEPGKRAATEPRSSSAATS